MSNKILNKSRIEKMFDVDVEVKRTTGWKYSETRYTLFTSKFYITIGKYKYKRSKKVDYYLIVKELTNVKRYTKEYDDLLSKYGTLTIIKNRTYRPLIKRGGLNIDDLYELLIKVKKMEMIVVVSDETKTNILKYSGGEVDRGRL